MKEEGNKVKRRGFISVGLVAVGGVLGWVARKFQGPDAVRKATPVTKENRFEYDLSKFEKTDPSILTYEPMGGFETGLSKVKRLDVAPDGRILVAGERKIRFYSANGQPNPSVEILLDKPTHCLHVAGDDELIVGVANRIEIYDFNGARKVQGPQLPGKAFLTAIATHGDSIFLADAGNREVVVCNRKTGKEELRFGKKDEEKGNPGFAVPSPYFDLAVAPDGRLRVADTGRLQMETYTLEGEFQSAWGQPGMKVDRFCGCCNPAYFTLTPDGDFITSEKGLARINHYTGDGEFLGAVAGPDTLVPDKEKVRRANLGGTVGVGFDIAINQQGHVLALDPHRKTVRTFAPKQES
jgi:hypothetical protein|tara:strand:- start:2410 stop:3468 length:1059 start_codon:yes stop_codon:yes gene_type:complete